MAKEPPRKTVLVGGYARLPAGLTAAEMFKVVGVGAEIDFHTAEVLEVDCTLVTGTAKRFFASILLGRNLLEIDDILVEIEERYHGNAQKALIAAVKAVHDRYLSLRGI
ncbi:MAG: DUF3870 domain-containing protein [Firmicutes bacterium]|nr:DUF3870 domain-containing protein [Bacillota bacterium]